MPNLRTNRLSRNFILIGLSLACAAGCGPSGFLITPVVTSRQLKETVVWRESVWSGEKIVLVDVDGLIMNARSKGLFREGEQPVSLLAEKLDKAARDGAVKAVVLRINSPGGTVTASDLMYSQLVRFRQTGKPVVAVMMDLAASGGYYIACAADRIIAHPTTVTGSIGVIFQTFNLAGTMSKLGIEADAIKSGLNKDAGSPLRRMTPEEREIFQKLVSEFHERFIQTVCKSRKNLTEQKVRELADGRVYTGQQAAQYGLVDGLGTLEDAVALAKELSGAKSIKVVRYHRPLGYVPNVYARTPDNAPTVNLVNVNWPEWLNPDTPYFMYLWAPGR